MSGHTPGPWRAEFSENGGYDCMTHAWRVWSENPMRGVADIDLGSYGQTRGVYAFRSVEAEANARLIAAAPDLLAVARMVVAYFGDDPIDPILDGDIALRNAARAAIAKAEVQR